MAAVVNRPNRKRQLASDLIFEVNEADCSPSSSPRQADEDINYSVSETETSSQTSLENSQISKKVKNQNQISKLDVDLRCMDMDVDSPPSNKPLVTFIFRDEDIANQYKSKIVKYFKSLVDIELNEDSQSKLEINLWEKSIDVIDSTPPDKETENLFIVDTTPSRRCEYLPRYLAKDCSIIDDSIPDEAGAAGTARTSACFQNTCFNCDGNHTLRECNKPKNHQRINLARSRFQSSAQQKSVRYHLDDEQKYSHLKPGKISDNLRRALNVRRNEIPSFVYRMRIHGYPPGWLQEAINNKTKLEVFDFDGCKINSLADNTKVFDADKIVEYPGFNVPLQNGFRDEYRYQNCPPYSETQSKQAMINYIENLTENAKEDDKKTDNVINTKQLHDNESDSNSQSIEITEKHERSSSPSLIDLEMRKKQLLLELANGGLLDSPQTSQDSAGGTTPNQGSTDSTTPTHPDSSPTIVSSIFGTPVLKSASPYAQLPDRDKFSRDISQVINFENLPDSTGKYEQMTKVINKVREIVRSVSDEQKS